MSSKNGVRRCPLKPQSSSHERFEVFYDGQCPMCKREIDMVRRKDKSQRLLLTDISRNDFQPTDRSLDTLMREIHGRFPSGEYVVGVDVFREIYSRLGFGAFVGVSRVFGIRHLLGLGYRAFSYWRFKAAMKRMGRLGKDCQSCRLDTADLAINEKESSND